MVLPTLGGPGRTSPEVSGVAGKTHGKPDSRGVGSWSLKFKGFRSLGSLGFRF